MAGSDPCLSDHWEALSEVIAGAVHAGFVLGPNGLSSIRMYSLSGKTGRRYNERFSRLYEK